MAEEEKVKFLMKIKIEKLNNKNYNYLLLTKSYESRRIEKL